MSGSVANPRQRRDNNRLNNKTLKHMESKKGINLFFAFIAFILGLTLFKHIDFQNFTLKDPVLDILYLIVFVICIYLIIKDYTKRPEK